MNRVDRRTMMAGAVSLAAGPPARAQGVLNLQSATVADLNAAFDRGDLNAERLIQLCLARVRAYEPRLNAVIALNPRALDTARALDAERRAKGPRSPVHGLPVVLKDNFDTIDMPTTGGSFVLADSRPRRDAFVVERLRAAGAIILAKVNLSEFAAGDPMSSIRGQTHNPYNLDYIAGGSSGGTGAAIAAAYATLGLGTDTGGSVRGPSTIDGIVGLKPTKGLLGMGGVIPLARTFDTPGPMARHVYDVAAMLGIMVGEDARDAATHGVRAPKDYLPFLRRDALQGRRLGLVRTFTGNDADYDQAIEAAAARIRAAGGEVVDVTIPNWLMDVKGPFYTQLRWPEFRPQIEAYLSTLAPGYPHTLDELIARSEALTVPNPQGYVRNPSRWALFHEEAASAPLSDPDYLVLHDQGLALVRAVMEAMLDKDRLDALLYLTTSVRAPLIAQDKAKPYVQGFGSTDWATQLASLGGFPDLVVPCGYTHDGLPVGMSFMGRRFSEPKLLALGYAFEALAPVRRPPPLTPPLPGEAIALRS